MPDDLKLTLAAMEKIIMDASGIPKRFLMNNDKEEIEKKIHKKIEKVLVEIPNTSEYKEDLKIVREIKQEYITTKTMPKSTMLYLNKIYKQITKNEEDDANTKSPGTKKEWSAKEERLQQLAGLFNKDEYYTERHNKKIAELTGQKEYDDNRDGLRKHVGF